MEYTEITKPGAEQMAVPPNLDHESSLVSDFDWTKIEKELGIHDREELNLAHLAIDRHTNSYRRDKVALH